MSDWTQYDLLFHRAHTTPERTAVIDADTDTRIDWTDLDTRVGRLAATLDDDVTPGDRVALCMGTTPAFVQTYWAVTRVGGVPVPLDPDNPESKLRSRIEHAGIDCLICRDPTKPPATEIGVSTTLYWNGGDTGGGTAFTPAESVLPPVERAPTDDHVIVFTSGTTGDPKGVRLSATNLIANAVGAALRLGVDPGDRWLNCLPTHHMGGLAPVVRTALYGTTMVLQPEFDVDTTPQTLQTYDVTGVSMVPTMLYRLLETDWSHPPALDTVLLGGAPAGTPLLERATDRDIPVYPTYGLTETASQATTATPDTVVTHPETVGRPLLVTDVTIVDADGHVCPPDEIGEIHVAGPTVADAYLDPDTTATAFTDHGLATGDLGSRDEAGRLTVYGRIDDQILTGGETVAPQTVVETLETHSGIEAAAVVGVPDPEWGERVGALIVPTDDTTLTTEAVQQHCRQTLAGFELPRIIEFADTLPRTASGTIDRDAVRDRLASATGNDQV